MDNELREFAFHLRRRVNKLRKRTIELKHPGHLGKCTCSACTSHRLLIDAVNEVVALAELYPVKTSARYAISHAYDSNDRVYLLRHSGNAWVEVGSYASDAMAMEALSEEIEKDRVIAERIE